MWARVTPMIRAKTLRDAIAGLTPNFRSKTGNTG
jgi:hypothetical protein